MSDTPKTDSASLGMVDGKIWIMECVSAAFARKLERDRVQLIEAIEMLLKEIDGKHIEYGHHSTASSAVRALLKDMGIHE